VTQGSHLDRESARSISRRRFAKVVVALLGVTGFAGAARSGALALHSDGWDDDGVFESSGGSGASGGSGWDDDWDSPSSAASGNSGWDDDWDDD
jgi:hypothetical protein